VQLKPSEHYGLRQEAVEAAGRDNGAQIGVDFRAPFRSNPIWTPLTGRLKLATS
jgi:hypothetical protein